MLLGGLVRGRQKTGLSTDRTEGTGEADRSYFRGMEGKMLVELIEEGICKKERTDSPCEDILLHKGTERWAAAEISVSLGEGTEFQRVHMT